MFTNIILTIVAGVLGLLFNILMAFAVEKDCRARNIKSKTTYSLLTFFFPIVVGIVYACTRKNAQKISAEPVPNAQKLAKKSVIIFIAAVIAFVAASGIQVYSLVTAAGDAVDKLDDIAYYDMKGNEYEASGDIIFYDKEGNAYNCAIDEDTYESSYVNQTTGDSYDSYNCYVDKDGYFYYDEDESIQMNDDFTAFYDTDGAEYFAISDVYWDADGEMQSISESELNSIGSLFE